MRLFNVQIGLTLTLFCMLSSCMVGPNFHQPLAPDTQRYTNASQPLKTITIAAAGKNGKAQSMVYNRDLPSEWWQVFHSPALNHLIELGLAQNATLAAAKAALIQAQELYYAQIGTNLLPTASIQLNAQRQQINSAGLNFGSLAQTTKFHIPPFNLFNLPIMASYTFDVFGGLRRQVEAMGAQMETQQFELEAAFLTLSANIVTAAINSASLSEQVRATKELIRYQQQVLKIINAQFQLGGVAKATVLQQQAQLAQTQALLPTLEQQFIANQHSLAVLVGELPETNALPTIQLNRLQLPSQLPVSIPSRLVRQRPDIRAAEARVHVASAQIGVATANLLPQLTLSGTFGWQARNWNALLDPTSKYWNWGGSALQALFNGGALRANRRASIAAFQQAASQYRQTVLEAFQNVSDILRAIQHDALILNAQKTAEIAAKGALDLTLIQYRLGGGTYLALLNAERTYQEAHINRIKAEATRFNDSAALFVSLGGGWWNRPSLQCNQYLIKNVCQYLPGHFFSAACGLCQT